MSRKLNYVQCTMKRKLVSGVLQTTSYIPQQFAVIGKTLKLKGDDEL